MTKTIFQAIFAMALSAGALAPVAALAGPVQWVESHLPPPCSVWRPA